MDDDRSLADAIAAGDERAERQFDARFRQRLAMLARRRGVPPQDAEDVAQEAVTDAAIQLRRGAFRGDATMSTFVHVIAIRRIADYWRRTQRQLPEAPAQVPALGSIPPSAEATAIVREGWSRLSVADRLVLDLGVVQGCTLEEIGRRLGIRKSAAGVRLSRAAERFRAALTGDGQAPRRLKD